MAQTNALTSSGTASDTVVIGYRPEEHQAAAALGVGEDSTINVTVGVADITSTTLVGTAKCLVVLANGAEIIVPDTKINVDAQITDATS